MNFGKRYTQHLRCLFLLFRAPPVLQSLRVHDLLWPLARSRRMKTKRKLETEIEMKLIIQIRIPTCSWTVSWKWLSEAKCFFFPLLFLFYSVSPRDGTKHIGCASPGQTERRETEMHAGLNRIAARCNALQLSHWSLLGSTPLSIFLESTASLLPIDTRVASDR